MAISRALFIKAALVGMTVTGGATVMAGCGSGAPPNSKYAGTYRATYLTPATGETGTFSFTVEQKGRMTGSFTDIFNKTKGFTGSVGNNGSFDGQVTDTTGTYPINGTLTAQGGDFRITRGSVDQQGSFTTAGTLPTPAPSPTPTPTVTNTFTGAYRGTYGIPEQNENGNLSFTVDPSGNITGFFSQTANQPVATLTAIVAGDGNFTGNLTYPNNAPAVRPISGKFAASKASTGGVSGDFNVTINGVARPGNLEATIGASEVNSAFRASYSNGDLLTNTFDASNLPSGTLPSSLAISFDVDKEGSFIGVIGQNKVSGRITNDGRVVGIITSNNQNYTFRGIINKLTVSYTTLVNNVLTPKTFPGVNASLLITIGGSEYPATLTALGGSGSGA